MSQPVLFIAGDIGGTNCRLRLYLTQRTAEAARTGEQIDAGVGQKEVLLGEETYPSQNYPSLEDVITIFLAKYNTAARPVYCMAFAVAGPVNNNTCRFTNLHWVIDGAVVARTFGAQTVRIMNDFVGNGYGLLALSDADLELVYTPPGFKKQDLPRTGVKAVIGAGTGLGQCFLTHNGLQYDVWASEGGHTDFAPRNETEFGILKEVKKIDPRITRVSVERVVSGIGLPNIYSYFSSQNPGQVNAEAAAMISANPALAGIVISQYASSGACSVCVQTMDAFTSAYGAETGNLALKMLPFGGIYIAGGIAAKNMPIMHKNEQYIAAYLDKGRISPHLQRMPIYLIKHPQVGLLGSQVICRRIIYAPVAKILPSKL